MPQVAAMIAPPPVPSSRNVILTSTPHNTRYKEADIETLISFLNEKGFDGISAKRFLEKNKYIDHVISKGQAPRNNIDCYDALYVKYQSVFE